MQNILEKEMATHSSVLAWRIPGTGEPGGLLSMGSQSRTRLKRLSSSSSRISSVQFSSVAQSCPTLCDPIDGSPPGSPVPGILQARILEWVAISFSNAWKWKVKVKSLSHVQLFATPWTAAYQAPPSMGLSSQEYWSGRLLQLVCCASQIGLLIMDFSVLPTSEERKK